MVGELKQTDGKIRRGNNLEISYFDQSRSDLNPNLSIKKTLCPNGGDYVQLPQDKAGRDTEMHVASYLRQFMFDPRELDTKVSTLSGGESSRLLLAKTLTKPGNLLIMDEPTNDLDMDSLEILLETLSEYTGTAIIVSHDRDFLERLVTRTLVFSKDGKVDDVVGGYDDWLKDRKTGGKSKNSSSQRHPRGRVSGSRGPQDTREELEQASLLHHEIPEILLKQNARMTENSQRMTYKDQHLLDTLPKQIEILEARVREIEGILSDHSLYSKDPTRFALLSKELVSAQEEIEKKVERWMEIEGRR